MKKQSMFYTKTYFVFINKLLCFISPQAHPRIHARAQLEQMALATGKKVGGIAQFPIKIITVFGVFPRKVPFAAGNRAPRRCAPDDMVDLHPALRSPSATPLRSGEYASEVKRDDGTSASAETTKKNAPYGR